MKSFCLISKQGQKYRITIPEPRQDITSAYIFAFARSGSTLLNNMIETYCAQMRVPTFSLFNSAFDQGVPTQDIQEDASICFQKNGYIYTGFRHFPFFDLDISGAPAIWLVRDPRDMLVSQYYSVLRSHVIPEGLVFFKRNRQLAGKLDVNQYAINTAKVFARQFNFYREMLAKGNLSIFRYEDVIYDKENWLNNVIDKLGLEQNQALITTIANQFDVVPNSEDENKHIRQVHPGDHTKKLTKETIQALNNSLADFLSYFDYEH